MRRLASSLLLAIALVVVAGSAGCSSPSATTDARPNAADGPRPAEARAVVDAADASRDAVADAARTLAERFLEVPLDGLSFDWADVVALESGEAVVSWQRIAADKRRQWIGTGTTGDVQQVHPRVAISELPLELTTKVQLFEAGGKVFGLAYAGGTAGTTLLFSRSDDGGRTWSTAQSLATVTAGGYAAELFVHGAKVHLAYRTSGEAVYYRGSADSGETWSLPKKIVTSDHIPRPPSIVTDGAGAIVILVGVGTPTQARAFRSADGGDSWSEGVCVHLRADGSCVNGLALAVKHGGGRFHALWYSLSSYTVWHGVSTDGQSWQPTDLATEDLLASWEVDAAGRVHVAWDEAPGSGDSHSAHYRRFVGAAWQQPVVLDADGGGGIVGTFPSVAVAGDVVHLVWRGKDASATSPAGARVRWLSSVDGGATLTQPREIDQGAGHAINFARASAKGHHAMVLWDSDAGASAALLLRRVVAP